MGANFLDNYLYSGQEIADMGNVIVVTLGYRVGTLGFLSSGATDMPGRLDLESRLQSLCHCRGKYWKY